MTMGQEIILYFEIIPLFIFITIGLIESYYNKKRSFKNQIWTLRREYKRKNEEYEKQEFLWKIKHGLSTGIDKPKINNVA